MTVHELEAIMKVAIMQESKGAKIFDTSAIDEKIKDLNGIERMVKITNHIARKLEGE